MNPQDQADAESVARKILEELMKMRELSKTQFCRMDIPPRNLYEVCTSYLTLSTQLEKLQSENARLREKIRYLCADCHHTSSMRKDVHSPWVCAACGVLIKQLNGAGEKCKPTCCCSGCVG